MSHLSTSNPAPFFADDTVEAGYAANYASGAAAAARLTAWYRFLAAGGVFGKPNPALDNLSDGWSADPIPTTAVAIAGAYNTKAQTGTRIHYIDYVDGHDGTAAVHGGVAGSAWSHLGTDTTKPDFYLWDGTNIIDSAGRTAPAEGPFSGVAYGTDPFQPSVAIKPFKTYCFCGLKSDADEPIGNLDNTPDRTVTSSAVRGASPDWWLFKRGVTHNLYDDFFAWNTLRGVSTTIDTECMSLAGPASGTTMLGAYGDPTLTRPEFVSPGSAFFARHQSGTNFELRNAIVKSLHFNGSDRTNIVGTSFLPFGFSFVGGSTGEITFEDMWFDRVAQNQGQTDWDVTMFRCLVIDTFVNVGNGGQGLFFADLDSLNQGTGTPYTAKLNITECVFARNGFAADPTVTWPPANYNIFTRNLYLTGQLDQANTNLSDNILLYGASSDQLRCGGNMERNFIYSSRMSHGGHGRNNGTDPTGYAADNFLLGYEAEAGIGNPSGHQAAGWLINFGAHNVTFERNVWSLAQCGRDIEMNNGVISFQSTHGSFGDRIYQKVDNNLVQDCIFDVGTVTTYGIQTIGGMSMGFHRGPHPGIGTNNEVKNCVFIKPAGSMQGNNTALLGWYGFQQTGKSERTSAAAPRSDRGKYATFITPTIIGTPIPQNWEMTVLSLSPTVMSVVGTCPDGTDLGAQADLTDGVPYANAYWSCSDITDESLAFGVGETVRFAYNDGTTVSAVETTNTTYSTMADAVSGESFPDVDRTIKTFLEANGQTVISDDGYTEYIDLLKGVRKGNWPAWLTPNYILNYMREGWGLPSV